MSGAAVDGSAPTVRRLLAEDAALSRALLDVFARAFEQPDIYRPRRPSDAYLGALLGEGPAIALYEKFGIREEGRHFAIAVDGSRPAPP